MARIRRSKMEYFTGGGSSPPVTLSEVGQGRSHGRMNVVVRNGMHLALVTLLALVLTGCLASDSGFDETTTGGGGGGGGLPALPGDSAAGPDLRITSAQVNNEGHPVVEFTLLDGRGAPITDLSAASFTFAKLAPRSRYGQGYDWVNYITRERPVADSGWMLAVSENNPTGAPMFGNAIQGNIENNGTLENLGNGEYRYTYNLNVNQASRTITGENVGQLWRCVEDGSHDSHEFSDRRQAETELGEAIRCSWADGTTLPRGVRIEGSGNTLTYTVEYNDDWTHRVGMQLGGGLVANAWYDFIPATGERPTHGVDATRDMISLDSCNTCHDGTLRKHGGNRVEPQYCVTCHNPGSVDPVSGRSIDFKQMVHKIHRGQSLPSVRAGVPYFIRNNDFSKLRFPQAVHDNGNIGHVGNYASHGVLPNGNPIPRQASFGIDNCVKCHMGQETRDELVLIAGGEDLLAKQKLARVTPDGDNWWGPTRTVEACAACHDNVFWYNFSDADVALPGGVHPDETLPALLAQRFGASTEGPRGDWRSGHRTGFNPDTGWQGDGTLAGALGSSLFVTGNCGGCHNQTPVGDAANIGLRGIEQGGNNRVRVTRAHLSFTRAGIRQDQLRIELEPATLDPAAETVTFRLRVRDDAKNVYLRHDVNATFSLGFVMGWREEGFADFTHSSDVNNNWPGRTTDFGCNAGCWTSGSGSNITIAGPTGSGYYTVTLDVSSIIDTMPENGTGSIAVQHQVVPLDALGAVDSVWDDSRTPIVNALHRVTTFAIGNAVPTPRRQVVDVEDTCRSCHIRFAKHGGNRRNNPELCVHCHNPNNTDISHAARRGVEGQFDGKLEESKDFKRMIHHIHRANMGADGIQLRALVFGGPAPRGDEDGQWENAHHFPGSIANCNTCHVNDSYKLPLAEGVIGSTHRSFDWETGNFANAGAVAFGADNELNNLEQHRKFSPIASVCTSCHTNPDWFENHIQPRGGSMSAGINNLDPGGENCLTCHGPGGDADISQVHDIRPR